MDNPNSFNNKQLIKSDDSIVMKYTHAPLVGKSKKYSGVFSAAITKSSTNEYSLKSQLTTQNLSTNK